MNTKETLNKIKTLLGMEIETPKPEETKTVEIVEPIVTVVAPVVVEETKTEKAKLTKEVKLAEVPVEKPAETKLVEKTDSERIAELETQMAEVMKILEQVSQNMTSTKETVETMAKETIVAPVTMKKNTEKKFEEMTEFEKFWALRKK